MNVVIYARYSAGPKQTEQSIEGQVRVCTDFCKQRGMSIVEIYADRHISGKTDARPEFQRLVHDAKKHKFDAVVVYKTDRFARNKYDSAIYKQQLKRAGVQLFYAAEAIPDGPEGIILESLMEGLAEYYSAELSQKVRRGIHESALKGRILGSVIPFGFRASEDHKYEPDPETAPWVQKIFEMYIAGERVSDICNYLNARGVRTKQNGKFKQNNINRIIKNRKYFGEYLSAGVLKPNHIPPIISEETFYLAAKEMEKRRFGKAKRADTAEYLLAGKLFCGHCGAAMHGVSGTSKTKKVHYYYSCSGRKKKQCNKTAVQRDALEARVVELTRDFLLRSDLVKEIAHRLHELQSESDTTKEKLAQYNRKLRENREAADNLLKVLEKGVVSETILTRLKDLEEEKTALTEEISYLKATDFGLSEEQLEFFLLQYLQKQDENEHEYRKRIIESFVTWVKIWDDRLEIGYTLTRGSEPLQYAAALESSSSDTASPLVASLDEPRTGIRILVFREGFALRASISSRIAV